MNNSTSCSHCWCIAMLILVVTLTHMRKRSLCGRFASIRSAHGYVCGECSWLLTCPLRVVPSLSKGARGGGRGQWLCMIDNWNWAWEKSGKQSSSMVSASGLWPAEVPVRTTGWGEPFPPTLLLVVMFFTVTESKLECASFEVFPLLAVQYSAFVGSCFHLFCFVLAGWRLGVSGGKAMSITGILPSRLSPNLRFPMAAVSCLWPLSSLRWLQHLGCYQSVSRFTPFPLRVAMLPCCT